MDAKEFERYVSLIEPGFYHNLDLHYVNLDRAETTLRWFDFREEWHPVVKTMAHGAYYYGEDQWMKAFAA